MSLEVSGLILLSSDAVIIFLDGIFVCVLMLIWSILMVEYISKVPVENGFNNLMGWIHFNFICI